MRRVLRDNPLEVSKRELSQRESNSVLKLILAVLCRVPLESGFGHSSILRLRHTKSHTYIWRRGELPPTQQANQAGRPIDPLRAWVLAVQSRSNHNKAAFAFANKLAPICYATLRDGEPYAAARLTKKMQQTAYPLPA